MAVVLCPLSQALVLHAFHKKHPPAHAQFSIEQGFEKVYTSGTDAETQSCPVNRMLTLSVLFAPDPANPPTQPLGLMQQELEESGVRKIAEQRFNCRHFQNWDIAPSGQPELSEDWWRLAGVDYKSELASSCGCC
jgi:hypothetical protein